MESIGELAADEQTARVLLAIASEPGDVVTGRLLRTVGATQTVQSALATTPTGVEAELWRRRVAPRLDAERARQVTADGARAGFEVLIPGDPHWPAGLADLGDRAPVALWATGDTALLEAPVSERVTVTGARAATAYGEHVAAQLADDTVQDGRQVVSGGAYGIDGAAHRAALAAGGPTIAILASGLDRLYPTGNQEMLHQVGQSGLLLSEVPPGSAPTRWRFQQRARIMAALSGALVVVEAGNRSGALHAAACARDLGRPVGAVPGPVTSTVSAGCHRLLREHTASLVTGYDDLRTLLDTTSRASSPARTMRQAAGLSESPFAATPGSRHSPEPGLSL